MTNEEAIERLETHTQYYVPVDDLCALEMAIFALREQEERVGEVSKTLGWISVEERLPEPNHAVLVRRVLSLGGNGYMAIDHILSAEPYAGAWFGDLQTWKSVVTHWMPLPSPPKEEINA